MLILGFDLRRLAAFVLLAAAATVAGCNPAASNTPQPVSGGGSSVGAPKDEGPTPHEAPPGEVPASELSEEDAPPVSLLGPHPKAESPNARHEFQMIAQAQPGEHTFVIKNVGTAPLLLARGKATCKCTAFEIDRRSVPPGESAKVTVRWKPTGEPQPLFQQSAPVKTNDPDRREIVFTIVGTLNQELRLLPDQTWDFGQLLEGADSEFVGTLVSPVLEKFEITKLTASHELISAVAEPLDEDALKEHKAKSGYKVRVKAAAAMPIGTFKERLTIQTDVRDGVQLDVELHGSHPGPVEILGPKWFPRRMLADLGTFQADRGTTVNYSMFVHGDRADLVFEDCTSTSDILKVTVVPDEKFKGKSRRFQLKLEVPPGSKPGLKTGKNPAEVKIRTNQADIGTITLRVIYAAL